MTRGILFIGGRGPSSDCVRGILRDGDIICAADSGLDTALAAGIRPRFAVGDMDSISDTGLLKMFAASAVERHPRDKDETDAALGLIRLRNEGCGPLIMIGGGEGRLDHTLALLKLFGRDIRPDWWYTAREEIICIEGTVNLEGEPGDSISFYPVGSGPWKAASSGLKWKLDSVRWNGEQMSLSNRFSKRTPRIDVKQGRFLCIRPIRTLRQAAPRE